MTNLEYMLAQSYPRISPLHFNALIFWVIVVPAVWLHFYPLSKTWGATELPSVTRSPERNIKAALM